MHDRLSAVRFGRQAARSRCASHRHRARMLASVTIGPYVQVGGRGYDTTCRTISEAT
jgi:hypothetical protein